MGETAYDLGPWQWYWRTAEHDDSQPDCGVFYERREGHAYSVCRAPRYVSKEKWEANARLIAAAPEFLAALKAVVGWWDQDGGNMDQILKAAQAVIDKAEGR